MMPAEAAGRDLDTFAVEVADHLGRAPRELPSKYFYDTLGSTLFEAICLLPWYRITRAESGLLERHAHDILRPLDRPLTLAELGCGSGEKLERFASLAGERFASIELVDISAAALESARRRMELANVGPVALHEGTYEQGLDALAATPSSGARQVLFLGSNIGNFEPEAARALLARIHGALSAGDGLLLGSDLIKPEADLRLAYEDPLQVTAAFNLNLLRRINDELGGTFDLGAWVHRAVWNAEKSRVEMHLVSRCAQRVRIEAAGLDLMFEAEESIRTEASYKYRPADVLALGRAAGFTGDEQWIDQAAGFALTRFRA
jgi:dimethylhistidine N-methyltransferase